MKNLVNKVKEQLHQNHTPRLNLVGVVNQALKKSDFNSNDERQMNEIITLLKKEVPSRTQQDIDTIRLTFFRFKFFHDLEQKMGAEIVTNLYKQLSYEFTPRRHVVFNLGDIGRKFYIILKGTVYVLVRKKGLQDGSLPNEEEEKREEELRKKSIRKATRRLKKQSQTASMFMTQKTLKVEEDELYQHMPEGEYLESRFPFLQKVGTMSNGDSFGEIALTKQMPRTATIVASEDTHFATVTREQFNKLLSAYYQYIQQLNVSFLQKIPVFSDWNEQMLNQLYYHFNFEEKNLFQILYQEGDEAKHIYLVKTGEIELSQRIEIGSPGDVNLTLQKFFIKSEKKFERVRSSIINAGQIFGHEEILAGTTRQQKAMCVSQTASLFVLDRQRFMTYFQRGGAIEKLKAFDSKRSSARASSLNAIKEIKQIKPQLEQREIPVVAEKDMLKDFVIPRTKNAITRVGSEQKIQGYQLLQGKGHVNKVHYNFTKNIDSIRRNMKPTEPLLLENALIDVNGNKGQALNIMGKIFPGATRAKYEIPNYSMSPHLVMKSLKLPKILTEVDAVLSRPDKQFYQSFCAHSYTTSNQFVKPEPVADEENSVLL